jgi:chemotaxis protein histidine kinase CheA
MKIAKWRESLRPKEQAALIGESSSFVQNPPERDWSKVLESDLPYKGNTQAAMKSQDRPALKDIFSWLKFQEMNGEAAVQAQAQKQADDETKRKWAEEQQGTEQENAAKKRAEAVEKEAEKIALEKATRKAEAQRKSVEDERKAAELAKHAALKKAREEAETKKNGAHNSREEAAREKATELKTIEEAAKRNAADEKRVRDNEDAARKRKEDDLRYSQKQAEAKVAKRPSPEDLSQLLIRALSSANIKEGVEELVGQLLAGGIRCGAELAAASDVSLSEMGLKKGPRMKLAKWRASYGSSLATAAAATDSTRLPSTDPTQVLIEALSTANIKEGVEEMVSLLLAGGIRSGNELAAASDESFSEMGLKKGQRVKIAQWRASFGKSISPGAAAAPVPAPAATTTDAAGPPPADPAQLLIDALSSANIKEGVEELVGQLLAGGIRSGKELSAASDESLSEMGLKKGPRMKIARWAGGS